MKKILIASALAALLVAGIFVGQAKFDDDQGEVRPAVIQNPARQHSKSSNDIEFNSVNRDRGFDQNAEPYSGRSIREIAPGTDYVPMGNPKGNKIIKSAQIEITIKNDTIQSKYQEVTKLLPEKSYIESSQSYSQTSTFTVRIPSEKLDATLISLHKVGTLVSESVYSLDKTFDAIDIDARLKIMREREVVLNNLLLNAKTSAETGTIQEQIFSLRTQIESLQGQKDLLENEVALSTLSITLTESDVAQAEAKKTSMISQAWTASAKALLTSLGGIMIVFTATLPFLILVAIGSYIFRQISRKSKIAKGTKALDVDKE